MRRSQTAWVLIFGIVITVAATSTGTSTDDSAAILNFRPSNVTLNTLYYWVGSYFNGTTHFEFFPYAGLAASESEYRGCPVLRNQTITKDYKSLLALTEPSTYNTANDPVNAFLTLWPLGFDFTSIPDADVLPFELSDSLDFAVYSSEPVFGTYDLNMTTNNFIWSLQETQAPPYNLSSTLTHYRGYAMSEGVDDALQVNSTTANCSGTEVSSWQFTPLSYNPTYNGTNLTNPVINLQFDGQTANVSMKGYVSANSIYKTGPLYQEGDLAFAGEFTMTFSGVIDTYHSDVLRNDTATPKWLRTVGYQNNSLNIGYTSGSAGGQPVGLWPLAMIIVLSSILMFFC